LSRRARAPAADRQGRRVVDIHGQGLERLGASTKRRDIRFRVIITGPDLLADGDPAASDRDPCGSCFGATSRGYRTRTTPHRQRFGCRHAKRCRAIALIATLSDVSVAARFFPIDGRTRKDQKVQTVSKTTQLCYSYSNSQRGRDTKGTAPISPVDRRRLAPFTASVNGPYRKLCKTAFPGSGLFSGQLYRKAFVSWPRTICFTRASECEHRTCCLLCGKCHAPQLDQVPRRTGQKIIRFSSAWHSHAPAKSKLWIPAATGPRPQQKD